MFDNLKADTRRLREFKTRGAPWYVIESLLFENGYQAVVLYRLSHWFKRRRIPVIPPLIHRCAIWLTGVDIAPAAEIGPGLVIGHGTGTVIGDRVRLGAHADLAHHVTLGGSRERAEMPRIGDHVFLGTGACVLGGVTVGEECFIGAYAVVTEDVPPRSKVLSTARIEVSPRSADGRRPAVR